MRIQNFFKLLIAVAVSEAAGIVGSVFTTPSVVGPSTGAGLNWYATLIKPAFNPPAWIFGPVWTILFALMGISAWLVWRKLDSGLPVRQAGSEAGITEQIKITLGIFIGQLALNALWSIIFFGLHSPGGALFEIVFLWLAILATIVAFYKISRPAAGLLAPYILWVSFAGYLNYSIWTLNQEEPGTRPVKLYYYNSELDKDAFGNVACSRNGLMPVEREIPITQTPIQDTINLLLSGGLAATERARGIGTEYPLDGLSLKSASLRNRILTLEFDDSKNKTIGGACRVGILWFQIEETAKQFSEVQQVRFAPEEIFQP